MAVVGYLGKSASEGVIFEVSEQTVRTLKNWKWSGSVRYAVHNRHNYHALTEYTGMERLRIKLNEDKRKTKHFTMQELVPTRPGNIS